MLQNRAQTARESMKTTLELPGPLSGPWTPAERELGSALVMCVRAHNLLHPPPLNENPGSAPECGLFFIVVSPAMPVVHKVLPSMLQRLVPNQTNMEGDQSVQSHNNAQ